MKRTLLLIAIWITAGIVHADTQYVKNGQRLNLGAFFALDTIGRIKVADSVTLQADRDDGTAIYRRWTSFSASYTTGGTYPTAGGWFALKTNATETFGYFKVNVWADSLGGSAAVGHWFSIWIRTWYQGQPMEKQHQVYVTSGDMPTLLGHIFDSAVVYRQSDSAIRALTITSDSLMRLINVYQGLNVCAIGNGSTTTSVVTTLTQTATDFWKYKSLCFIRGTLAGQTREITAYNGTTKTFTTTAFTSAPSNGDTAVLIPGAASGSSGSSVTVAGYAAGQDPATLVLGASSSSWNTSNTIGALLNWAGTSSNFLGRSDLGISADTVNDASSTTSTFVGKVTVTGTDFWKDKAVVMTSGALALCTRRVTAYNYSTKQYTTDPFPSSPTNGATFILVPIGSSQSIASVTVGGYTSGNAPEDRLLVTPANKLATDASGRIDVGSWRGVAVAAPMTGGYPKVDTYGWRGFGPVPAPTLVGGEYVPDVYNVRNNVLGRVNGNIAGIDPNGISEQAFQSGAVSARVVSDSTFDAPDFTGALISRIVDKFWEADTAGHTADWFAATAMGKLSSQTGAQSLDSAIVARIVWAITWGIKKTANNTDTSTVTQRAVSGLSVTIDSAQISRIVGRVVWGLASGSGSDSSSATQRVISFNQQGLVNAIWNEVKSGHTVSGSFGNNLDLPVSSVAGLAGNGAYTWNIYVVDTGAAPDTVIQQALVFVNNAAQNTIPYQTLTDNNGKARFQLNAGTWVTFTTEPGFLPVLRSFSMSATGTDTIKVTKGYTGRPLLALYGGLGSGTRWDSSRVQIELVSVHDSTLMVGDTVIASNGKGYITTYTNRLGQATVPLYSNGTFINDSTYYRMTVTDMRRGRLLSRFAFRMPSSTGTVWLKDVVTWKEN